MRIAVVGGFERSGHDAMAEALASEGFRRGHSVHTWRWSDAHPAIGTHPVFRIGRRAAAAGNAAFVQITASDELIQALLADLRTVLSTTSLGTMDAILSVHPWGTLALADWLSAQPLPLLVDCHSDFTPFPVFPHDRVTSFVGTGEPRIVSASVSRRQHELGLPVRESFLNMSATDRAPILVVNAGSDGWAIDLMSHAVTSVLRLVAPSDVILLAPTSDAAEAWGKTTRRFPVSRVAEGIGDIGPMLGSASWFLTKGGGTPIAEGLAAGCRVFAKYTGIPWEDQGIDWLTRRGWVIPVGDQYPHAWSSAFSTAPAPSLAAIRRRLTRAASSIWEHVEDGAPQNRIDELTKVASSLMSDSDEYSSDALAATTSTLRRTLLPWL